MSEKKQPGVPEQALRDAAVFPDNDVLREALAEAWPVYAEWIALLEHEALTLEWRFYTDGKAWLGKVLFKKKTLCWLSIWHGYFKVSFYFTEKTASGIQELPIDAGLKCTFAETSFRGKLKLLAIDAAAPVALDDLKTLLSYKKKLK